MDRRTALSALGTGLVALAGCGRLRPTPGSGSGPAAATPPRAVPGGGVADVDLPVPRRELSYALPRDGIRAITEPVFGTDWTGVEIPGYGGDAATPRLRPDDRVIGVVRDGMARAYPLRVLEAHEVVNDVLGGPLLVTYCPLCGSGVTAVRRADGVATTFGVSGKLWRSDLVLYDEATDSLWSQLLARAIRGPETGARLELTPSTLTTWAGWQDAHPDTRVLRPPPESGTVGPDRGAFYGPRRSGGYRESDVVGAGYDAPVDDRLHPKTLVLGVRHDGVARAYPLPTVREAGVVHDRVGGLPVVVAAVDGSLVGYDRRVGGETLRFERTGRRTVRAGGSRWGLLTGEARDGRRLRRASARSPLFWFAWAAFNPDTGIYDR